MFLRHTILLAMGIPLAACGGATDPLGSLDIAISVEPASFRIGDTARFEVTLHNPTSDTIWLHNLGCNVRFDVYDASGAVVSTLSQCWTQDVTEAVLPGEQRLPPFRWRGESGELTDVLPPPDEFLAPGTYRVQAVVMLSTGGRTRQDGLARELRSGRVAVQLLSPG